MSERWAPIVSASSYEVSDFGRVRRLVAGGNWPVGHELSPASSDSGHLYFMLFINGKQKKFYVQRLVLVTFVSDPPFDGAMALHKDDVPTNNYWENLYWGTRVDNHNDRMKNKGWDRLSTSAKGSKVKGSKLKECDIPKIRELRLSGMKLRDIANIYGVNSPCICDIVNGKKWRHV